MDSVTLDWRHGSHPRLSRSRVWVRSGYVSEDQSAKIHWSHRRRSRFLGDTRDDSRLCHRIRAYTSDGTQGGLPASTARSEQSKAAPCLGVWSRGGVVQPRASIAYGSLLALHAKLAGRNKKFSKMPLT